MVDLDSLHGVGLGEPMDWKALRVRARVALRGANDRGGRTRFPAHLWHPRLEIALRTTQGHLEEVRVEERQQHLRLRVTKAAIVLKEHRPILREHETTIEHANILAALLGQGLDRPLQDLLHRYLVFRCQARRRGVGAHTPGVGSLVVVVDALVVLSRCHHRCDRAVGEGHAAALLADEQLLNHDLVASRTKSLVHHDLLDSSLGLFNVLRHEHPLPSSKPAGLDNHLTPCSVLILNVFVCGVMIPGIEGFEGSRWQVVLCEEVLGESLGRLKLGSHLRGTEAWDAGGCASVRETGAKRRFRADEDQGDLLLLSNTHEALNVAVGNGEVRHAVLCGCAPVSRRAENVLHLRRLPEFDGNGMLAPTATNDQDIHCCHVCVERIDA
mmetsp:Transcript_95138/g.246318  ORF Transcript_95138/g.246318 Transcript_95138/m.246318 type:complete len:384 (-) Transcript_95138:51-1202(-)